LEAEAEASGISLLTPYAQLFRIRGSTRPAAALVGGREGLGLVLVTVLTVCMFRFVSSKNNQGYVGRVGRQKRQTWAGKIFSVLGGLNSPGFAAS